jgi:hypothetical protein
VSLQFWRHRIQRDEPTANGIMKEKRLPVWLVMFFSALDFCPRPPFPRQRALDSGVGPAKSTSNLAFAELTTHLGTAVDLTAFR